MRNVAVLIVVAVLLLLALNVARAQRAAQIEKKDYSRRRAELLAGTLKGLGGQIPIAAVEVRVREHNGAILAVFDAGVVAFVRDQVRTIVNIFTPGNEEMRSAGAALLNALGTRAVAIDNPVLVDEPPLMHAAGYLRREGVLYGTLPLPLDAPRSGPLDLADALREADALSTRLFRRSLRGV
jgi:hypothetical protein